VKKLNLWFGSKKNVFAADIFDRLLADASGRQLYACSPANPLAYSLAVSVQDIASKLEIAAVQGGLGFEFRF
jgi:hypothetical protein